MGVVCEVYLSWKARQVVERQTPAECDPNCAILADGCWRDSATVIMFKRKPGKNSVAVGDKRSVATGYIVILHCFVALRSSNCVSTQRVAFHCLLDCSTQATLHPYFKIDLFDKLVLCFLGLRLL